MTTLIAGIGYLGEALADALHASGEAVAGLTKSPESAATLDKTKPYPVFACDITNGDEVRRLVSRVSGLRSIVACASSGRGGADVYRAVYLEGARHLADVFEPERILFTSSTSVYAQTGGELVTEDSPAEPDRETGRILLEAEDLVLARGGTVARLAGIYGPGRSVILKKFLAGEAVIEDDGARFLNQTHRDDIVSALALLLNAPEAAGRLYNICDDTPLSQVECYAFLAEHFGMPLPPSGPRDLNRKRGWTNKRVSNAKLRESGWRPKYPSFRDAITSDSALVTSIEAQL